MVNEMMIYTHHSLLKLTTNYSLLTILFCENKKPEAKGKSLSVIIIAGGDK
jgi:hypothetical protein